MPINNIAIRNHKNTSIKHQRMFFVLENDLKQQLREIAQANYVSESQFVRESVRRNITAYKKALHRWKTKKSQLMSLTQKRKIMLFVPIAKNYWKTSSQTYQRTRR